MAKMISK